MKARHTLLQTSILGFLVMGGGGLPNAGAPLARIGNNTPRPPGYVTNPGTGRPQQPAGQYENIHDHNIYQPYEIPLPRGQKPK